jgi:hypothetical protein
MRGRIGALEKLVSGYRSIALEQGQRETAACELELECPKASLAGTIDLMTRISTAGNLIISWKRLVQEALN